MIYLHSSKEITKKIELRTDLAEPISTSLNQPIIDIDLALSASGFCVAALDNQRNIHIEKKSFQKNLVTDEKSAVGSGTTINLKQTESDFRFVRVSGWEINFLYLLRLELSNVL